MENWVDSGVNISQPKVILYTLCSSVLELVGTTCGNHFRRQQPLLDSVVFLKRFLPEKEREQRFFTNIENWAKPGIKLDKIDSVHAVFIPEVHTNMLKPFSEDRLIQILLP